jgi:hypothetical protein
VPAARASGFGVGAGRGPVLAGGALGLSGELVPAAQSVLENGCGCPSGREMTDGSSALGHLEGDGVPHLLGVEATHGSGGGGSPVESARSGGTEAGMPDVERKSGRALSECGLREAVQIQLDAP